MVDVSPQNRKVAFIHINRTGGSTFRRILQNMFGDGYHFALDPTLPGIAGDMAKYQALEFHVVVTADDMFMTHAQIGQQDRWDLFDDSAVFVLFRDPVDYYLSTYHHSVQRRAFIEPSLVARGFKFPDSLEEFMSWQPTFNAELSYFLGIQRDTGYCPTRADLEKAKQILSRPNFHVGLTERMADAVHILQRETGRRVAGGLIHNVNRNPQRPALETVPDSVKETIRRNSSLDYELYDFARNLSLADTACCGTISEFRFEEEAVPEVQLANADVVQHQHLPMVQARGSAQGREAFVITGGRPAGWAVCLAESHSPEPPEYPQPKRPASLRAQSSTLRPSLRRSAVSSSF